MSNKHNKKRNVGIIYELFLRHIGTLVINNEKQSISKATKIIEKRFKKGTELFKEFRIFNALINASIDSEKLACDLIKESKHLAGQINQSKLQREKSFLIKEINHKLNDKKFYYRSVPNYRQYANLQNLLNEWSDGANSNLKSIVEKEQKMLNWLLRENSNEKININIDSSQSNNLVVGLMTEKINKKYSKFSLSQKEIIQNYALYGDANQEKFLKYLAEKKKETLSEVNVYKEECDNKVLLEKIDIVYKNIENVNVDIVSDDSIVKFLTMTELLKELKR